MTKEQTTKQYKKKFQFSFSGDDVAGHSLRFDLQKGDLKFHKEGKILNNPKIQRGIVFEGLNGEKITNLYEHDSLSELSFLSEFDTIVAIDTNKKAYGRDIIHICCFFIIEINREQNGYRMKKLSDLHFYEFWNVNENIHSEINSMVRLFNEYFFIKQFEQDKKIALITDHDRDNHINYNRKAKALYEDIYLPNNVTLIYAKDSRSKELTSQMVKMCDANANDYFNQFQVGRINNDFDCVEEYCPYEKFRFNTKNYKLLDDFFPDESFEATKGSLMEVYEISDDNRRKLISQVRFV